MSHATMPDESVNSVERTDSKVWTRAKNSQCNSSKRTLLIKPSGGQQEQHMARLGWLSLSNVSEPLSLISVV